jgi:hypothetical protein
MALPRHRVTDDVDGEDDDGGAQARMPTYTEQRLRE